jgi:hypothetical protein
MSDCNAIAKENSPWWAKLLDRFGVPTAMLAVVLFFSYETAQWLGENILVPVTNGHIHLLESVRDESKKQTFTLEEINTTNVQILKHTQENNRLMKLMEGRSCMYLESRPTEGEK